LLSLDLDPLAGLHSVKVGKQHDEWHQEGRRSSGRGGLLALVATSLAITTTLLALTTKHPRWLATSR
jgi:hypothetical protein